MTTIFTTPPPARQSIARTPPAPLHGAGDDNYQPYTTRKSARFIKQRATKTPPPDLTTCFSHSKRTESSMTASAVPSAAHTYSPPSSAQTTPKSFQKNDKSKSEDMCRESRTRESMKKSESFYPPNEVLTSDQTTALLNNMLPTPAKTPRKRAVQHGIGSTARILFPNKPDSMDEAMPTPRKMGRKSKKHIGFSLDSPGEDDGASSEGKIEIYTDSKDKIPEVDESEDNPFYVKPGPEKAPTVRSSKRRKVSGKANIDSELEESFKREDGMVYVFRGKKIFRKFPKEDPLPDIDDTPLSLPFSNTPLALSNSPRLGPLTRSSIKPRLLFPTETQCAARQRPKDLSDEEAVTDIEHSEGEEVTTPVKQTFAPASPPTTGRATRASGRKRAQEEREQEKKLDMDIDEQGVGNKSGSPFDGWARTKKPPGVGVGKGKKREGEVLEKVVKGSKRVRGSAKSSGV